VSAEGVQRVCRGCAEGEQQGDQMDHSISTMGWPSTRLFWTRSEYVVGEAAEPKVLTLG
jgi:hypothetical protein